MKNLIYIFIIAVAVASCSKAKNPKGMKGAANKAKVQRFYDEVINAHNPVMVDSFCTASFIDHNPDPPHTGKGADDLKANFKDFFNAYPDIHVATNFMIAQGDTVVAYITMSGTNSGAMGTMPATNKQINIEGIDIITIKDGMATDRWGFFDNMKMMQQLGMMPAAGAMPDSAAMKMNMDKK